MIWQETQNKQLKRKTTKFYEKSSGQRFPGSSDLVALMKAI